MLIQIQLKNIRNTNSNNFQNTSNVRSIGNYNPNLNIDAEKDYESGSEIEHSHSTLNFIEDFNSSYRKTRLCN